VNQSGFDLRANTDIFARGAESSNHVELHIFKEFHLEVFGVGPSANGFVP
jgi:hypothetical protein